MKKSFASDNNSGIHPDILRAINDVNQADHCLAYGQDSHTLAALCKFRSLFGEDSEAFFVMTGTGANVLALQAITKPYQAVICAETAHVNVDECGAPEKFTGCKLLTVPTKDGKITVDGIADCLRGVGDEHHVQPAVVSITQATEYGTVYAPDEIRGISHFTRDHGMLLHMDGARFSNARARFPAMAIRDMTFGMGVDVLSFGGTKNGMLFGEAVVFRNHGLAKDFKFIRKQGMQLASKMRFISAQFNVFLGEFFMLHNATQANQMAQLLAIKISPVNGVDITQKVESNAVFVKMPREVVDKLLEQFDFYVWNENDPRNPEIRLMCSFDMVEADVSNFADCLTAIVAQLATQKEADRVRESRKIGVDNAD